MYHRMIALALVFLTFGALTFIASSATAQESAWKGTWQVVRLNKDQPGKRILVAELTFGAKVDMQKLSVDVLDKSSYPFVRGAAVSGEVDMNTKSLTVTVTKQGRKATMWVAEPKDGKGLGFIDTGSGRLPVRLELQTGDSGTRPSTADPASLIADADQEKDLVERENKLVAIQTYFKNDHSVLFAVHTRLLQATARIVPLDRGKITKAGDQYVELYKRYGREMEIDAYQWVVGELAATGKLDEVAIEYAQKARNRLLPSSDPPEFQIPILRQVVTLGKKVHKPEPEAEKRLTELEKKVAETVRADIKMGLENAGLQLAPLARPAGAGDRVVLVELFIGAEGVSTAATELAVQELLLEPGAKPTDLAVIVYHLNTPDPDPLAAPAGAYRAAALEVRGTPTVFVDGVRQKGPAGSFPTDTPSFKVVAEAYSELRKAVVERLKVEPEAKISLTVQKRESSSPVLSVEKGPGRFLGLVALTKKTSTSLSVSAELPKLPADRDPLRLRIALIEESHQYTGRNGVKIHYNFVRQMLSSKPNPMTSSASNPTDGFQIEKTAGEVPKIECEVNIDNLKAEIQRFLKGGEFDPNVEKPLSLKNLKVVAFVQNTRTGAILQTTQKEVLAPAPMPPAPGNEQ